MSTGVFDFRGKAFIVTGGRSGIGERVVERLLEAGASVASIDIAAVPEVDQGERLDLACDVTSESAVNEAVEDVTARFGGIDGVVQSAGIAEDAVLWKMTDKAWSDVLDVNLKGAFHVLRAVVPVLRERGGGSIVNIASINGLRGKFGQANYAASKAGLIGLTKTAARELGAFHVRVNAIAPGLVRTPMIAALPRYFVDEAVEQAILDRVTEPDDVADAVLFLLSDMARQITGETLRVDAGQYI